ncbi:MAG: hypothetical protein JSV93_06615 [Candidatus Omnitrophota bacterium]|nr:MAG: hypothetical protein JSV93_06615 [Candidatus Omnitrophota bacterium]
MRINIMNKKLITLSIVFCLTISIGLSLFLSKREVEYDGFAYRGDDHSYGRFGKKIAEAWRAGKELPKDSCLKWGFTGAPLYFFYCGIIYYIFGQAGTHVLLVMNSVFHVLILIPVYFICREVKVKPAWWLFLFWPSTFYWSLFNLKDTMCLLILFMIIHFILQVERKKDLFNALGLLLFLALGSGIRSAFNALFLIAPFYLAIRWKWNKLVLFLLVGFFLIMQQDVLAPRKSIFMAPVVHFPATCSSIRANPYISAITSYSQYPTKTWLSTIAYFPKGIFTALFYPFLFTKLKYTLISIESVIWWCFLPFVFRGMLNRKALLLTMIFFTWLAFLALTQGIMGTLLRLKSVLYYLGFILCIRNE